jgi:hypothetical protein
MGNNAGTSTYAPVAPFLFTLIMFAAPLLSSACGSNRTMSRSDIRITLAELRSEAAQVKLIAGTVRVNSTTVAYRSAQLSFLTDKIRETTEKLAVGKAEVGLERQLFYGRQFGGQISNDLRELVSSLEDRQKAGEIEADLDKIVLQLLGVEASLRV